MKNVFLIVKIFVLFFYFYLYKSTIVFCPKIYNNSMPLDVSCDRNIYNECSYILYYKYNQNKLIRTNTKLESNVIIKTVNCKCSDYGIYGDYWICQYIWIKIH